MTVSAVTSLPSVKRTVSPANDSMFGFGCTAPLLTRSVIRWLTVGCASPRR